MSIKEFKNDFTYVDQISKKADNYGATYKINLSIFLNQVCAAW